MSTEDRSELSHRMLLLMDCLETGEVDAWESDDADADELDALYVEREAAMDAFNAHVCGELIKFGRCCCYDEIVMDWDCSVDDEEMQHEADRSFEEDGLIIVDQRERTEDEFVQKLIDEESVASKEAGEIEEQEQICEDYVQLHTLSFSETAMGGAWRR